MIVYIIFYNFHKFLWFEVFVHFSFIEYFCNIEFRDQIEGMIWGLVSVLVKFWISMSLFCTFFYLVLKGTNIDHLKPVFRTIHKGYPEKVFESKIFPKLTFIAVSRKKIYEKLPKFSKRRFRCQICVKWSLFKIFGAFGAEKWVTYRFSPRRWIKISRKNCSSSNFDVIGYILNDKSTLGVLPSNWSPTLTI